MPAKIKPNQALQFAKSLAKGEPNRMKIAGTVLEDKGRELIYIEQRHKITRLPV